MKKSLKMKKRSSDDTFARLAALTMDFIHSFCLMSLTENVGALVAFFVGFGADGVQSGSGSFCRRQEEDATSSSSMISEETVALSTCQSVSLFREYEVDTDCMAL